VRVCWGDSNDAGPTGGAEVAETIERVLTAARTLARLPADRVVGLPDPDPWAWPNLDGDARHRGQLSVEDLRRAALTAADLDDPEIMDNGWR
jgi:hypothetical protein